MDCVNKEIRYLKDEDCYFVENVMLDIRAYLNVLNETPNKNKVLLLPPVNNFRRFLVHKLVIESYANYNLSTLSIGKLDGRRTVIFPSSLIHMEKNENTPEVKPSPSNVADDAKKKSIPIYRPPAVRKRENVARSSILKKQERKSRKPDLQIYIPRAKRLNCSQSDECSVVESIQDENKPDCEIEIETKSKEDVAGNECEKSSFQEESETNTFDDVEFIGIVEPDKKVSDANEISDNTKCSLNTEVNRSNENIDLSYNRDNSTVRDKSLCSSNDIKHVPIVPSMKNTLVAQTMNSTPKEDIEIISLDDSSSQSVEDVEFLSCSLPASDSLGQIEAAAATPKSDTPVTDLKKTEKPKRTSSQNKSLNVDSCDWEELFDESGEYVDRSLFDELMTAFGNVSVQRANQDYRSFQTEEERSSDGECIIEVYGFPSEFKTEDLFDVFTAYRSDRGFQIVWVDDTHALAIFSSPLIADEVLNTQLPFVKTRPIKNGISKSKMKASNFALPPATRPKTCVSLARRLVSGHLGMKIDVTPKQREAERKLLSDAREQKRLMAKQKFDAWEGSSSGEKS